MRAWERREAEASGQRLLARVYAVVAVALAAIAAAAAVASLEHARRARGAEAGIWIGGVWVT